MSSNRKRAAIRKANAEADDLRQKLAHAEAWVSIWKSAAEYGAQQADDRQAVIDRLMLEHCPDEMTQDQKERWAASQRPSDVLPHNAKVSGAGTASAGLPGYTAGDNTE